jgi:predicted dehydrogenase
VVQKADGMMYAPSAKPNPVCDRGAFRVAAVGLDHGHIYGMCNGLVEAGAELVSVFDPDPAKVAAFLAAYPGARAARSEDEILDDRTVHLVASAAVPCNRAPLGLRVMRSGKDFFADKPPVTTLEQLQAVREEIANTGRKYAVYYSERVHVEAAVFADRLVAEGAIGRVLHVIGLGPHRLNASTRPPWFWDRTKYGGILCDLGCHQIEQFLHWTGAKGATLLGSRVSHRGEGGFEDFGDASFVADNGATHYVMVHWHTPDGLGAWGDGRVFLVGTEGSIELRKYLDVARDPEGDHVYLVDRRGERHFAVHGQVGFPYFGRLVLDCLNRTETAMPQEHALLAIELALLAQKRAAAAHGDAGTTQILRY